MAITFTDSWYQVDFEDGHMDAPLRKKIPVGKDRKTWRRAVEAANKGLFATCKTEAAANSKLAKLVKLYPDHHDCFSVAEMMGMGF